MAQAENKETLKQLIDEINKIPKGSMRHNLVSFKLRKIADKFGIEAANKVIDDLKLPFHKAKK